MNNRDLKKIEKKITRKRGFLALINTKQPKDLAELLTRLIIEKEATVIRYKNGNQRNHCSSNRCRSAEDAYLVAKAIFPEITLEQVDNILLKLREKVLVSRNYCTTVKRIVHNSFISRINAIDRVRKALGSLNVTNEKKSTDKKTSK